MRALSKTRANRYPDAKSLSLDVERFLAGQSVSSHSESIVERANRLIRNHRGIALATAIALAAVACILLFSYVSEMQKKLELAEANKATETARDKTRRTRGDSDAILKINAEFLSRIGEENPHTIDQMWNVAETFKNTDPKDLTANAELFSMLSTAFTKLKEGEKSEKFAPVSYTHLTLPTICSV